MGDLGSRILPVKRLAISTDHDIEFVPELMVYEKERTADSEV